MPFKLSSDFNRMADGVARIVLQIEMKRRNISNQELLEMLNMLGAKENIKNLRNKIGRGTFSAGFFLMCIIAMGGREVQITLDPKVIKDLGIK